MTRRVWETEDGWTVATGWDRPLQHFFMDISKECECSANGDGEEDCTKCGGRGDIFKFDNLSNAMYVGRLGGMSLSEVKNELERFLSEWPEDVIKDLQKDKLNDNGNHTKQYGVVGQLKG